ncbi:MAG: DMT family transporter [Saprospiraceae bacterium]
MKPTQRAYLELHIAVLLYGLTAILGDLIDLSAIVLVWWRVLLTSIGMLFLIRVSRTWQQLPRKLILQYMGIGVIVGVHWITFYGAIKLSNASIALVSFATTSFFTSLLEPLLFKVRVKWYELMLGLMILPGMALVVSSIDLSMVYGIYVGLFSAFLAALFSVLNKKLINETHAYNITFLELGSACLFITLLLPFYFNSESDALFFPPTELDWLWIGILVVFCTILAYILNLRALKQLTAFASTLTINLEPVYGIILAWALLNDHEEVGANFYWGVLIILAVVFSYPILKRRME